MKTTWKAAKQKLAALGLAKFMLGTDAVITGENTSGVYYRRADDTDETKGSVKVTVNQKLYGEEF